MIRFAAEALVGVVIALVITFTVMNTMFMLGPWADPPGMTELSYVLLTAAIVVAGVRAVRRRRAAQ